MQTVSAFSPDQERQTSLEQALKVVDAAAAAFWNWSRLDFEQRSEILERMAAALDKNREKFILLAAREIGAAASWTNFNIDLSIELLRQARSVGPALQDQQLRNEQTGIVSTLTRSPAGVVLGIAPWNASLVLATRAIALPLACGNTAVLKCSEHCPRTHETLVRTFNDAGLPDGVLGFVVNEPDVAEQLVSSLIEHPSVRRINFTGSTRVGREVAVLAARQLKPCLLELSDKAALLVLDDADLPAAADAACYGAFFNQGQICMATERVIVSEAVAARFVELFVDKVRDLKASDPATSATALGRMINAEAANRVRGLIDNAIGHGGELLVGGEVAGAIMQPAIVDHVSSAMRLYHEEVFGPVASILRVHDDDEAVSVANDTRFGLTAAIFSRDTRRARSLADRLETGIVQINGPTVFDDPAMPFGGMKDSGHGRFGASHAVNEFTELRWIAEHPSVSAPCLADGI